MVGLTKRKIRARLYRLAYRNVNSNTDNSNFNVNVLLSDGSINNCNFNENSDGNVNCNSIPCGVRPVASICLGYIDYGYIR